MYHLLAGQAPCEGMTLTQIVTHKLSSGPRTLSEFRGDLDPRTVDLVSRMMSRQPSDRPDRYSHLIREIDQLLKTLPSMAGSMTGASSSLKYVEPAFDTTSLTGAHAKTTLAKTLVSPTTAPRGRRPWLWGLGAVVIAASAAAIWIPSTKTRTAGASALEPTGDTRHLFNGTTLAGWTPRAGQWTPTSDHEISGAGDGERDGIMGRVILRNDGAGGDIEPLPYYQLTMVVRLEGAEAVELHFGFAPTRSRNGERHVLRLTPTSLLLGHRPSDSGTFVEEQSKPLPVGESSGEQTLTIECRERDWTVLHDEEPVFAVPRREGGELPDFRLAVSGQTAYFSDIEVTELQPSPPSESGETTATPSP
jgi:hypothetical protein